MRRLFKLALLTLLVGGAVAIWSVGPGEQDLLRHQAELRSWVQAHLLQAAILFFFLEVTLVGLSLPFGTVLSLMAGILFGRWLGTLLVSFASTAGATLAMLSVRTIFASTARRFITRRPRWHRWVDRLDAGVRRDGWFYLLVIRMTPVLPFFGVNFGLGFTKIRVRTYWWASQLGMLPQTFVVVSLAAEFGELTSFRDLVSWRHLWPLTVFVLIPIGLKWLLYGWARTKLSAGDHSLADDDSRSESTADQQQDDQNQEEQKSDGQ